VNPGLRGKIKTADGEVPSPDAAQTDPAGVSAADLLQRTTSRADSWTVAARHTGNGVANYEA
jgi:hypothetical protein